MSRLARVFLGIILLLMAVGIFGLLSPSLFALLLLAMLFFAAIDLSSRRYQNAARTLNSTLRAVSHHDEGVLKVVVAFSRSGPLSGPCYEYARRLMMGQDAIEAATRSHVPLELSTAVAMQTPAARRSRQQGIDPDLVAVDSGGMPVHGGMPVYGQFLYLIITAIATCLVLGFLAVQIVPMFTEMYDEFGIEFRFRGYFSLAPAIWIVTLLCFVLTVLVPLFNRGHLLGARLPRWVPMMPRLAHRRADVLRGLADAIEAGWPMGRALALGHAVALGKPQRRLLERAMELIEQGQTPAAAIQQTGWIDAAEASWLAGASPLRTVELLRTIADQGQRDAQSNLRWMMAIFFPLMVVALGAAVLAYAVGLFGTLMGLVHGLS